MQQDRQPEHEREQETEHHVRTADDDENHVAHRASRRVDGGRTRQAEERALHLAARAGGQDSPSAAGELVERQLPAGVMLAQTR